MVDYKKSKAPVTTHTQNIRDLDKGTSNIYESVMIIAKRANQISVEIKQELNRKLEEFAYYTDNLEEVFENREQIEISRFYERLPKPTLIALQEFLEDDIYYRVATPQPVKEEETE
jgi:DNA-directed RNA polymerase subunit K/omega